MFFKSITSILICSKLNECNSYSKSRVAISANLLSKLNSSLILSQGNLIMKLKIQSSLKYTCLQILTLIYLTGLSGCHPCSIIQCGNWVTAIAQNDGNGNIIIDIPNIKYSPKIKFISIEKINKNQIENNIQWSIIENDSADASKLQSSDLPIQYGHIPNRFRTQVNPIKLTTGTYRIRGEVYGIDKTGNKTHDNITGKFEYFNKSTSNN